MNYRRNEPRQNGSVHHVSFANNRKCEPVWNGRVIKLSECKGWQILTRMDAVKSHRVEKSFEKLLPWKNEQQMRKVCRIRAMFFQTWSEITSVTVFVFPILLHSGEPVWFWGDLNGTVQQPRWQKPAHHPPPTVADMEQSQWTLHRHCWTVKKGAPGTFFRGFNYWHQDWRYSGTVAKQQNEASLKINAYQIDLINSCFS